MGLEKCSRLRLTRSGGKVIKIIVRRVMVVDVKITVVDQLRALMYLRQNLIVSYYKLLVSFSYSG